jgi:hypothetical protein
MKEERSPAFAIAAEENPVSPGTAYGSVDPDFEYTPTVTDKDFWEYSQRGWVDAGTCDVHFDVPMVGPSPRVLKRSKDEAARRHEAKIRRAEARDRGIRRVSGIQSEVHRQRVRISIPGGRPLSH